MTLRCALTWAEDLPQQAQNSGVFKIRCPQGTCSVPLCRKGPLVALTFISQPQAPQGLTEVHSQALRSQTLKQFRCCRQVPAGPELPQRARDGFTRPLGTEATQRSLWAYRLTPVSPLAPSCLGLSIGSHQKPPAWPTPPGQRPSRLLVQQLMLALRQYKSSVLYFYVFCSSPHGQPDRTGKGRAQGLGLHPTQLPLPGLPAGLVVPSALRFMRMKKNLS